MLEQVFAIKKSSFVAVDYNSIEHVHSLVKQLNINLSTEINYRFLLVASKQPSK